MKAIYWTIIAIFGLGVVACKHQPLKKPIGSTDTTGNGGNNPKPCSPDSVYFNRDILPLLSSNCASSGCHDAASAQDGVILTDYQKIMSTGEIKPGDPFDSKLFEVITETDPDKIMPPPPSSALTTAQIALIKKWIEQGAKNNRCTECDTSKYKFLTDIDPLIKNNCTSCHSGSNPSGGVSLNNYAEIKASADNGTLRSVIEWNSSIKMPQSTKLPDCQIQKIIKWIENGAPND